MANAIGLAVRGLTMIPLLDEAFPNKIAKTTVVRISVETSTSEETQDKIAYREIFLGFDYSMLQDD